MALAPVLSSCFEEVNMQGVDLAGKWEHTLSHCSFMDDDEWQDFTAFRLIYQLKKDGTLAYGFPDSGSEFIAFGTWEKVDDSHFRLIEKKLWQHEYHHLPFCRKKRQQCHHSSTYGECNTRRARLFRTLGKALNG